MSLELKESKIVVDRSDNQQLDFFLAKAEEMSCRIIDPINPLAYFPHRIAEMVLDQPISNSTVLRVKEAGNLYRKLCRRFSYDWKRHDKIKPDFYNDLFGKFEDLSHFRVYGTSFQWALTDPIFRLCANPTVNDIQLFSIQKFQRYWDQAKYKENQPNLFLYYQRFCQLLFSNFQGETNPEKIITAQELEYWVIELPKKINFDLRPSDKNYLPFFCFHVNLLYFLAYKATSFSEVDEFIALFKFPVDMSLSALSSFYVGYVDKNY